MILLSIIYLFFLFVTINSVCTKDKPRKEGFLRSTCIPGFYKGSCLIILEKQSLHDATETCKYDYGGRLATAPTKDAIQIWIRTIYFNTKYTFDNETRFWIGYGKNDQNEFGFRYEKPNEVMEKYIGKSIWARVFGEPEKSASIQWENNANENLLDLSNCPNHGVVFNHKTAKFDIKHFVEAHYSLCETPRWAKLQCDRGWHLVPQLRMCLNVHEEDVNFLVAHSTCNSEGSFIATAQNGDELAMLRNVMNPYIVENIRETKYFWAGLKSESRTTYAMDGTTPLFYVANSNPGDKMCAAFSNENFCEERFTICDPSEKHSGIATPCILIYNDVFLPLPFMCQKFADQSIVKNI
uniref:C-type lectin domain-containing protein n=1 Tax=Panagrolaimus davidi TaxID=227884 RepID=A0A914PCT8_9BILA